ncbi:MAG: tRNA 2-thiouridine(34) synthase MnmA, partial [Acidobacteria bacterium]|nr:tRNA 2-thiouridine(34) synthase MnmA [Acidobacteriota bacterium]
MQDQLIAVAMSGGVDSSVVAAMLRAEGRDVVGMTMQLWNQRRFPELIPDGGAVGRCCSLDDVYDARRAAESAGIPFYVVNFEERFEREVVQPFVDDYVAGRTPIPCTLCNNFVKFDQFLDMARQAGAETIATGHYARIERDPATGRYLLLRGVDHSRDQSYFLWGLTQDQLSRSLFPLGGMQKAEVRALAHKLGVPVADKGESREICFVPNGDYARFVETYLDERGVPAGERTGEVVDATGQPLAEHGGIHRFTIGQRKGLGVATGQPLYVTEILPAERKVVVGPREALERREFEVERLNWISMAELTAPVEVEVKIRYQFRPVAATVSPSETPGRARVEMHAP